MAAKSIKHGSVAVLRVRRENEWMLDLILLAQCVGRVLIVQLPHIRLRLRVFARELAILQRAMDHSGGGAARLHVEPPVVQGFGEAIQSEAENEDDERDHREY